MQLQARPGCALRVGSTRIARRPRHVHLSASVRPVAAPVMDDSVPGPSRRDLMALAASALIGLAALPNSASAKTCASETLTEADDDACRAAVLRKDLNTVQTAEANYTNLSEKKFATAGGVPVAVLDSEYVRSTLKLRDDIISYATMDVNDFKARVPLIKAIKGEGSEWVSKYARGGSARTDSARRMYIAVDALIGHLAANGYAPMPKPKLKIVLANVDQAKTFLEEGK